MGWESNHRPSTYGHHCRVFNILNLIIIYYLVLCFTPLFMCILCVFMLIIFYLSIYLCVCTHSDSSGVHHRASCWPPSLTCRRQPALTPWGPVDTILILSCLKIPLSIHFFFFTSSSLSSVDVSRVDASFNESLWLWFKWIKGPVFLTQRSCHLCRWRWRCPFLSLLFAII